MNVVFEITRLPNAAAGARKSLPSERPRQNGEFAKAINRASQTIRKNYCLTGECFGIKPVKVGKFLLWPVVRIAALLNGDSAE